MVLNIISKQFMKVAWTISVNIVINYFLKLPNWEIISRQFMKVCLKTHENYKHHQNWKRYSSNITLFMFSYVCMFLSSIGHIILEQQLYLRTKLLREVVNIVYFPDQYNVEDPIKRQFQLLENWNNVTGVCSVVITEFWNVIYLFEFPRFYSLYFSFYVYTRMLFFLCFLTCDIY